MADTTIIGLCSGVGMLEEGIAAGLRYLGRRPRVLCHVERDAYAAADLLARMESEAMEPSPVWAGNLEDVRWEQFAGAVDIVCAGFPCQPHSMAGARKGIKDVRWIWPAIADCIHQVGPGLVLLENVPGLRSSGGFAPVLADLAALGFRIEWDSIRASDVGASHQRERVFILAFRESRGRRELRESSGRDGLADRGDEDMGNPTSERCGEARECCGTREPGTGEHGAELADTGSIRSASRISGQDAGNEGLAEVAIDGCHDGQLADTGRPGPEGNEQPIVCRAGGADQRRTAPQLREIPLFAPGPNDERWASIITERPELAPATPKPELRGLADGDAAGLDEYRADRLRCGGNGVVALQAAVGFIVLARRAGIA